MDMKKIYVTPEIEYDDFSLNDVICANLYGNSRGRTAEFYAIGGNGYDAGSSRTEGGVGDNGGQSGDDI